MQVEIPQKPSPVPREKRFDLEGCVLPKLVLGFGGIRERSGWILGQALCFSVSSGGQETHCSFNVQINSAQIACGELRYLGNNQKKSQQSICGKENSIFLPLGDQIDWMIRKRERRRE